MAILFVILAGAFVAISNLFMRKSIDSGGTTKGFLVFQMLASFGISVFLEPVRSGNFAWNGPIVVLGAIAGFILATMLVFLGKALEKGPPGLTFSILSSSTVAPAILMALLFGADLGFVYAPWHAFGSLLVLCGLFWAGRGLAGMQDLRGWILFCLSMFALHTALLVLLQWRALLLHVPDPLELTSFFNAEQIQSSWFLPSMFLSSAFVQIYLFLKTEKRVPEAIEALYGVFGGCANGIGTFFLICSTQAAGALENAIIFPMYSVAIIVLSNAWGQKLYQEKVNWKACQLCALGVLIGTVDWKGVLACFGW